MKYIRTKDGKILNRPHSNTEVFTSRYEIIKCADTIEELCDEFVVVKGTINESYTIEEIYEVACNEVEFAVDNYIEVYLYGAVWTNKGLIYVAKMNDKRELELI